MAKVRFFYALATIGAAVFFLHYPVTKIGLFALSLALLFFYLLIRAIYVPIPAKRYNLQHVCLCAESKEIVFKPLSDGWRVALVTHEYKRTPETEFTYTGTNGNGIEWQKNEVGIHRQKAGKKVHTLPGTFTDAQVKRLLRRLIKVEQGGGNIFNFAYLLEYADFIKLPLHKRILHLFTPSPTPPEGGITGVNVRYNAITFTQLLMFLPDMPDCIGYGIFVYQIGKAVVNYIYQQGRQDNLHLNRDEIINLTSRMIEADRAGETKEADRLNRQILSKH